MYSTSYFVANSSYLTMSYVSVQLLNNHVKSDKSDHTGYSQCKRKDMVSVIKLQQLIYQAKKIAFYH